VKVEILVDGVMWVRPAPDPEDLDADDGDE
jgi:hypothetical protein